MAGKRTVIWVNVTFVKYAEGDIRDEQRANQQDRERGEELGKDQRFVLECSLQGWILFFDVGGCAIDERGIAGRHAGKQIEIDCYAREFIAGANAVAVADSVPSRSAIAPAPR
jgi:hypothetical protein